MIIGLVMVYFGCSCQSLKKIKKSESSRYDSSFNNNFSSEKTTQDNSVVEEKKDVKKEGSVKVVLEYAGELSDSTKIRTVFIPTGNKDKSAIDKVINALVNERLRKVSIDGDFKLSDQGTTTTANNIKADEKSTDKSTGEIKKEEKKKGLQVERKGISIWWYIFGGLAVLLGLAGFLFFKFYFPFKFPRA